MRNIKIINDYDFDVNLNLQDVSNRNIPVKGNSFAMITEDEYAFIISTSQIFEDGTLIVGNPEVVPKEIGIIENDNVFTKERYEKLLKLTPNKLKKEISNVNNIDGLENLLKKAKTKDKGANFTSIIKEKIESLM